VAGYEYDDSGTAVGTVWKLAGGTVTKTPLIAGENGAGVGAFAAEGGDLYAAGAEYNSNGKAVATVWKLSEGKWAEFAALTNGTYNAFAYALAAQGGDLYAAGYEYNSNDKMVATVWKLSGETVTSTTLTDGTKDAEAHALAAQGGDLYAAGYKTIDHKGNDKMVATVWKLSEGGWAEFAALTDEYSSADSQAHALAAQGGNLYAAGYKDNGSSKNVATVWRLSGGIRLLTGENNTEAYALAAEGGDLYAAGLEYGTDKYAAAVWKLSSSTVTETVLAAGTENITARALAAEGGDLYAAGSEFNGTNNVATVWKLSGGTVTKTALTDGWRGAEAHAILLAWE
jgi:hypothetical protein